MSDSHTLRVFASDSYTAKIDDWTNGIDGKWPLLPKTASRGDTLYAGAYYDFVHHLPIYVPEVQTATGALLHFDLNSFPELRGMRNKRTRGPFGFLVKRDSSLQITRWGTPYYALNTRSPFMNLMDGRPSWWSNPIYEAQIGSYFDTKGGRACDYTLERGQLDVELVAGIDTYPQHTFERYQGYAEFTIESHTARNPPYIEIEYEPAPVEIVGCAPAAGFVDEHAVNRFSWSLVPAVTEALEGVVQERAEFQWRVAGQGEVCVVRVAGGETFCTLAAGILPNSDIEWRVRAVSDRGMQSDFSPWMRLTTVDAALLAPDSLSPNGGVRDGSRPIRFSWRHNSPLSTAPSAFEVQADLGDGFQDLSGRVTANTAGYEAPAGTLPSGPVSWRVRDRNSDGLVSEWSTPARFTVRAAPAAPVFRSVEAGNPRPLVSWTAGGQEAFCLVAERADGEAVYDSGTAFGAGTRWRMPVFLPDGRYRLRLRVQNRFGLWSEWAETRAAVETPRRMRVTASGSAVEGGVRIDYTAEVL